MTEGERDRHRQTDGRQGEGARDEPGGKASQREKENAVVREEDRAVDV